MRYIYIAKYNLCHCSYCPFMNRYRYMYSFAPLAQLGQEATSHSCWGRNSSPRLHTRTYDMTTCGLSREELAQNRWIGADQRCLAIRTDGIVCDCLYTAHHSAQAPTSGKYHPISFFYLLFNKLKQFSWTVKLK